MVAGLWFVVWQCDTGQVLRVRAVQELNWLSRKSIRGDRADNHTGEELPEQRKNNRTIAYPDLRHLY